MALTSVIQIKKMGDTETAVTVQKYVELSNGDNVLVPAIEDRQIQIMAMVMSTNVAGTFTLQTGTDPIFPFMLATGLTPPVTGPSPDLPIFVGNVGEDLNMNVNSSPTNAGVYLQYRYKQ